jgi:hypothetical protein
MLVWLYFLLTGGLSRKRALQTLLLVAILGVPAILWVSYVAPNLIEELHSNMLVGSALGGANDPGPAAVDPRMQGANMIDLQTSVAVFVNDPRIYNPATYLLCAPLLLVWGYVTLRKPSSPANARLALAAIVALSMLPLYHRQHDTQRFRNQVFHSFKASDSIGAFGLARCGEQIRIVILFLLFVVILYNV